MHIAEVVTIAKSLPLLRLNTYKSLILSYSADYRRIFQKNIMKNFVVPIIYYIFANVSHADGCKRHSNVLIVASREVGHSVNWEWRLLSACS